MLTTYIRIFYEFFKVGLFSIGGGLATLPFLADMGARTGWFTNTDLMNMLAVSESTPGPIGINMATYVGYTIGGLSGGVIATLGEICPSIIIILIIARILEKFRTNKYVNNAFYGLRPASTGLIGAALLGIFMEVVFTGRDSLGISIKALLLMPVIWFLSNKFRPTKNLHPICFIGISAVIGMIFGFAQ